METNTGKPKFGPDLWSGELIKYVTNRCNKGNSFGVSVRYGRPPRVWQVGARIFQACSQNLGRDTIELFQVKTSLQIESDQLLDSFMYSMEWKGALGDNLERKPLSSTAGGEADKGDSTCDTFFGPQ